jgi:ankyrin repeat protein
MQKDNTILICAARDNTEEIASNYLSRVIWMRKLPWLFKWFMRVDKKISLIDEQHAPWNFTALHEAVRKNHVEIIKMLLKARVDVSLNDIWGRTPLHYAGNTKVARMLVENGACLHHTDIHRHSILHRFIYECNHDMSCFLIESGVDCSVVDVNTRDKYGETVLFYAVARGRLEVVRCLLENGAHVGIHNSILLTPIHTAVKCGNLDIIRLLFMHGACVDQFGFGGTTALFFTIIADHEKVAEMLIHEYKADVTISLDAGSGATLLHTAAHASRAWAVELLVRNGADVNAKDRYGKTPLCYAVDRDEVFVAVQLLEHGATLWSKQSTGHIIRTIDIHGWRQKIISSTMTLIRLVYKRIDDASTALDMKKKAFSLMETIEPGIIDMILQDCTLDSSRDKIDVQSIIQEMSSMDVQDILQEMNLHSPTRYLLSGLSANHEVVGG